jgi:hypothetical protein
MEVRQCRNDALDADESRSGAEAHDSEGTKASDSSRKSSEGMFELRQNETLFVMACRSAAILSGISAPTNLSASDATDLLYQVLKKRDPGRFAAMPDDSNDAPVEKALKASSGRTAPRKRDIEGLIGPPIHADTYLDALHDRRKIPLCPGSVRQDLPETTNFCQMHHDKIAAINIGDIVVYEEKGYRGQAIVCKSVDGKNLVYAAVVAVVVKTSGKGTKSMQLLVRRLYQYHELLWIYDQLAPYRKNQMFNKIDFRSTAAHPEELKSNAAFIQAQSQFDAIRTKLKSCFDGIPGMNHKVFMVALSDFDMFLSPDCVYHVLPHTLCPAMLENVGPTIDSRWPPTWEQAEKTLCTRNVVWKSFLNTCTWTLHPISLRPAYMQDIVFGAASRTSAWVPRSVMQGMVGIVRRYIDSRIRRLGGADGQDRQAVLSVPCSFNLYAYLVASCRARDMQPVDMNAVNISWDASARSWNVRVATPNLLNSGELFAWNMTAQLRLMDLF